MRLRILHIVFAYTALTLLAGGCADRHALDTDRTEISFSASAVHLEEDTKGVTELDHRTEFALNDVISVWAWHNNEAAQIFTKQHVTLTDAVNHVWSYAEKKKWSWADNDWYDFLAIPGSGDDATSIPPTSNSPYSLSVHYDPRVQQSDLLMAGTRRKVTDPDPSDVVHLNFQHMLSAVKVLFYRDSGSQKFVITSFGFTDLVVSADIAGYWNESDNMFSYRLDNSEHNHQKMFGEDRNYAKPWLEPAKFVVTYDPGFYDLMIPQNLDSDDAPSLVVTFRDDVPGDYNEYTPDPIPLKDIIIKGSGTPGTPITRWEPGHVYVYEVHIMLNGGVLVNVITTKWEDVLAQTPGLMI